MRGKVTINNDKCINCGLCTSLCYPDALRLGNDTEYRLMYKREKCIGCGLCVDACIAGAISWE